MRLSTLLIAAALLTPLLGPSPAAAQAAVADDSEPPAAPIVTVPDVIAPATGDEPAADQPTPEPPPQQAGAEAAPVEAQVEAPGPFAWLFDNEVAAVAVVTVAGGLVGALAIGALTFLSPLYCGCCGLTGLPIGAVTTLAGATIGIGMARSWHCSQFWAPALVAGALGGVAGLIAGVVGVVVAQATGATLNTRTPLPDVATASALTSASAAGGASCLTMLVGSLLAAGGAAVVYLFQDGLEREHREARAEERAHDRSRTRRAVVATAQPAAVAY